MLHRSRISLESLEDSFLNANSNARGTFVHFIYYYHSAVLANFSFDPFLFEGKYTYMYIHKLNETLDYLNSVDSTIYVEQGEST